MSEETSHLIPISSEAGAASPAEALDGGRLLTSVALVGAGMLIEPELFGGALIGAGLVYGFPLVSKLLHPVMTTAVQLGYSAVASVSDLVADAVEQVHEVVVNAQADYRRRGTKQ